MLQPGHGIFILPWYDDPNDTAFQGLTPLLDVVNDQCSVEIPTQFAQVLYENRTPGKSMLPVQSVCYEPIRVDLVDDPICIVLGPSCPDHQLVSYDIHAVQEFMH